VEKKGGRIPRTLLETRRRSIWEVPTNTGEYHKSGVEDGGEEDKGMPSTGRSHRTLVNAPRIRQGDPSELPFGKAIAFNLKKRNSISRRGLYDDEEETARQHE